VKASIEINLADPKQATALLTMVLVMHPTLENDVARLLSREEISGTPLPTFSPPVRDGLDGDPEAAFSVATPDPAAVFAAAPIPPVVEAAADADPIAAFAGEAAGSIPAAPAPAPATVPAGAPVELDKDGLPWDKRIHATGADKKGVITQKGVWRSKKGVPSDLVTSVTAELRQTYPQPPKGGAAPAPAPAPIPLPPAAAPPAPPAAPSPPAAAPPVTPPPTAPTVTPAAPASAGPGPTVSPPEASASPSSAPTHVQEFARVMGIATKAQTAGTLTPETVTALVQQAGGATVADLMKSPALLPVFEALLLATLG